MHAVSCSSHYDFVIGPWGGIEGDEPTPRHVGTIPGRERVQLKGWGSLALGEGSRVA
jgi:hypothetical protein